VAKPTITPQTGAKRERDSAKHKKWSLRVNMMCEQPPRPLHQRWLRDIFIDVASTPPVSGGELARTKPAYEDWLLSE
jgi:hypothetical protein